MLPERPSLGSTRPSPGAMARTAQELWTEKQAKEQAPKGACLMTRFLTSDELSAQQH